MTFNLKQAEGNPLSLLRLDRLLTGCHLKIVLRRKTLNQQFQPVNILPRHDSLLDGRVESSHFPNAGARTMPKSRRQLTEGQFAAMGSGGQLFGLAAVAARAHPCRANRVLPIWQDHKELP